MILVLGGTTEGRELALELTQNGYPCLLSVTTEYGAKMVDSNIVRTRVGELGADAFKELLREKKIELIIDATHPYAVVIKEIARNVASTKGIIYGRFERPPALLPNDPNIVTVADYALAFEVLRNNQRGILFTIGVKNLSQFKLLWLERDRPIWVKIYPEAKSLEICRDLGLQPEQIFAFHGSGSKEILKAIIEMTGVSWLVTKESGNIGGINEKVAAALETGIKILVIKRPLSTAELVFHSINEVKEFMKINIGVL